MPNFNVKKGFLSEKSYDHLTTNSKHCLCLSPTHTDIKTVFQKSKTSVLPPEAILMSVCVTKNTDENRKICFAKNSFDFQLVWFWKTVSPFDCCVRASETKHETVPMVPHCSVGRWKAPFFILGQVAMLQYFCPTPLTNSTGAVMVSHLFCDVFVSLCAVFACCVRVHWRKRKTCFWFLKNGFDVCVRWA